MEAIKETIGNLLRGLEDKKRGISACDPQGLLKKALTKKELQHIKFNYFKRGILGVSVDSSAWLYKLSLQKEDLLHKLSGDLPAIKDIRFWVGEIQ